ncbi:hypothetical protein FACS1894107_14440 [Planctomycetales bacterium]|nr:hypothetical protein FACS1894107_14440 [Planctomycetales bacterium]GHS96843.1 hypothetical protein FACS1894108_02180 [Planctomycetales bacterium]
MFGNTNNSLPDNNGKSGGNFIPLSRYSGGAGGTGIGVVAMGGGGGAVGATAGGVVEMAGVGAAAGGAARWSTAATGGGTGASVAGAVGAAGTFLFLDLSTAITVLAKKWRKNRSIIKIKNYKLRITPEKILTFARGFIKIVRNELANQIP